MTAEPLSQAIETLPLDIIVPKDSSSMPDIHLGLGEIPLALALIIIFVKVITWIFCYVAPLRFLRFASELKNFSNVDLKVISVPVDWIINAGLRHRDRVLDEWIGFNAANIVEAYKTRMIPIDQFVALPANIRRRSGSPIFLQPTEYLAKAFKIQCPHVWIIGIGGSGKTALATWIGHQALEGQLGTIRRVPVLIDSDLIGDEDVSTRLLATLQNEYGVSWIDRQLVDALLREGRLLVILDRFGELAPESQKKLNPSGVGFPKTAYIVTARRIPLGVQAPDLYIEPSLLEGESLSTFVFRYLGNREKSIGAAKLSQARGFQILNMLGGIFGERAPSVLLAKLALDAIIDSGEAPLGLADLVRSYVQRLDRDVSSNLRPEGFTWPSPLEAAEKVSWAIIQPKLTVLELPRIDAIRSLGTTPSANEKLEYLVKYVQIFEWKGAGTRIGPTFDPIVEYLAALWLLDSEPRLGKFWTGFLKRLKEFATAATAEPAADGYEFVAALRTLAAERGHPVYELLVTDPVQRQ